MANADKFSAVTGVTAPEPSTVRITLKQPTPNLLTNLGGFKGLAIVERKNVESGQIATHPVGTGPFAFQSQKSGDSITLKANPGYWGGAPKVSGVTFRFISEPSTALSALQAGEIDWTDSIPTQRVAQLKDDDSITLATTPSNDYWYLALNEARAPWNDVRVRQAIAYAIDRDAIVQATSYGTAVANQLAIPKGNPWYTPYDAYRHDVERAKSLLREAGAAPKALDMLVTNEYPETVTAAQIIADNLAPLGITVNIRTVDFATWLDEQNNGHFDMLMMGWLGNIDPDDFYYAQHHTDGSSNAQKFSNPEVDRLLDAGRIETNRNARAGDYAKAATIIADQVSYIYLYNPSVIQAWTTRLSGYEARRDGAVRFRTASMASGGVA
jgi:peptide/nickel transport system substrate-binding protein